MHVFRFTSVAARPLHYLLAGFISRLDSYIQMNMFPIRLHINPSNAFLKQLMSFAE